MIQQQRQDHCALYELWLFSWKLSGERNCHPVANQYFLHIWMAASIIKMTIISEYPPTMGDHYFRIPQDASPDWHRPARRMRFIRSKTNIIITICKHCNHNPGIGGAYLSLIRIWICAIFGSGFPRELAAVPRLSSEIFDEGEEVNVSTLGRHYHQLSYWWQCWRRWWPYHSDEEGHNYDDNHFDVDEYSVWFVFEMLPDKSSKSVFDIILIKIKFYVWWSSWWLWWWWLQVAVLRVWFW